MNGSRDGTRRRWRRTGRITRWLAAAILAACIAALAGCGSGKKPTGAPASHTNRHSATLVPIGAGVNGLAGLHASVYAKGPPTLATIAFGPQGRLWMTAAGLKAHTHDGVYVLRRPGGNVQKVISGLNNPLGLEWYLGKLYVSSVGRVDAYWGFDGKRFTRHEMVLNGPLPGAENNQITPLRDGRLLMGVSATCDHCEPTSQWDGAIVSFRPNGSDLRLYASHIRAPVGLAYYPDINALFVTMNQRDDLGAATPGDWLSIVKEGQKWGFPGCWGQGGPSCSGVPRPLAVLEPHAAVGSVVLVPGEVLSSNSAAVAEWNVSKVQSVMLRASGGGFVGKAAPFLTGIAHPFGLTATPDRSLLVGSWQTGTIYRITASR